VGLCTSFTCTVSPLYNVQSLYISCYVSSNKLVLSYLSLCLLPQNQFYYNYYITYYYCFHFVVLFRRCLFSFFMLSLMSSFFYIIFVLIFSFIIFMSSFFYILNLVITFVLSLSSHFRSNFPSFGEKHF
jgi:hypothetical protein